MHEVAFVLKQSHLGVLDLLRPMAAAHELTPARFDLLYAVHGFLRLKLVPSEKSLAFTLGVSRATVCKMLRSLVELGFVSLTPCEEDRRRRLVRLTQLGRRRFRAVLRLARHRQVDAAIRSPYAGGIPSDGGFGAWLDRFVSPLQKYIWGMRLLGLCRRPFLYGWGGGYTPSPKFRRMLVSASPARQGAVARPTSFAPVVPPTAAGVPHALPS